jgi:hypothetical protein
MTKKLTAAIAIDNWKLPIFSKRLVEAGFRYEQVPGITKDSYLLTVIFDNGQQQKLAQLVLAANTEARKNPKRST